MFDMAVLKSGWLGGRYLVGGVVQNMPKTYTRAGGATKSPAKKPPTKGPRSVLCTTPPQRGRPRTKPLSTHRVSLTIVRTGADLELTEDQEEGFQEWAKANAHEGYITTERGEIEKHLHLQGYLSIETTSVQALKGL